MLLKTPRSRNIQSHLAKDSTKRNRQSDPTKLPLHEGGGTPKASRASAAFRHVYLNECEVTLQPVANLKNGVGSGRSSLLFGGHRSPVNALCNLDLYGFNKPRKLRQSKQPSDHQLRRSVVATSKDLSISQQSLKPPSTSFVKLRKKPDRKVKDLIVKIADHHVH